MAVTIVCLLQARRLEVDCHTTAAAVRNAHIAELQSLGWEDSLEESTATHSSVLAWRISWTEEPGRWAIVHGVAKSRT